MKKYSFALLSAMLLTISCSDYTDLQPKGKNLLTTTDHIEMLFNREYSFSNTDWRVVCGDAVSGFSYISTEISRPNKSRAVIMWTWDESNQDKMAELTASDYDYTEYYEIIGRIANPALTMVEDAEGDQSAKNHITCEALALRAWCHFMLINKFAKAYNPATAANDRGLVYITEDMDVQTAHSQISVQAYYDKIMDDINKAEELDGLPVVPVNRMRFSKPALLALKALVLQNMQKWNEAETAAKQSLAINSTVADLNDPKYLSTLTGYILGGTYPVLFKEKAKCEEDLFFTYNLEYFVPYGPEAWNRFEEGHACKEKMTTDRLMYDNFMGMAGMYLGEDSYTFTFDLNSGWNDAGLRVPQMYLVVAEAEIHKGNYDAAMENLDKIRVCRIDPEVYQPLQGNVNTLEDAVAHLKQTAHGENIYSNYNFIDRKRWNEVKGWEETITRELAGNTYTLKPGSSMWIFPIPMNAINNNSNLQQNYK